MLFSEKVCRDGTTVIDNIVNRNEITKEEGNRLKPKNCHAPRLSGLPKIHKDGVPMRGVVSTVGSPFDKLSRYLIPILRKIQGRSGLYVKNSRELKQKVKNWRIERNEILVSYDVKNLYPSIPIYEALKLVESLLSKCRTLNEVTDLSVRSIMELLKWMFGLAYCEYSGRHYVLGSGPIGLGATGEIAIIYMEEFQLRAMETSPYPLHEWYWYVDDSELKCKDEQSDDILEHLNSIKPGVIVFTKEDQVGDVLPVLDLKQKVDRKTKQVECMVHYKKTHTNINVKGKSNHPPGMKKGIIKGFADRARALCDEQYLEAELKNVEDVFVANGYDRSVVKKYMEKDNRSGREDEQQQYRGIVSITYVRGLSEQFKRLASKHQFRTTFKPGRKVKELKTRSQQPLGEKQKGVVYKIPCKCEKAVYIGETWRQLKTRKKEHENKVRLTNEDIKNGKLTAANERMKKEDGGLARHSVDCLSGVDWEKTRVVTNESGLRQRKVKEGIESLREIHYGTKVLNSFESLTTWRPILNRYFDNENNRARASEF